MPEIFIIPVTNPETFISFSESQALLTMVKNYMQTAPASAPAQWESKMSWAKGLPDQALLQNMYAPTAWGFSKKESNHQVR